MKKLTRGKFAGMSGDEENLDAMSERGRADREKEEHEKADPVGKTEISRLADPDPAIIQFLRVICDDKSTEQRRRWAVDALRPVLDNWIRDESIEKLIRDLGLSGKGKRRRAATVRTESEIAIACMDAAMDGEGRPFEYVETNTGHDEQRIRRAWKEWGPHYMEILEARMLLEPERIDQITLALKILKKQIKN
jgi:hypothetical protein